MTSNTAQISYNYGCDIKKDRGFKQNNFEKINEGSTNGPSLINTNVNPSPQNKPNGHHQMSTITYVNGPITQGLLNN